MSKMTEDQILTLFDQNMEENNGIYSFLIREKTIRTRDYRTLYCLFQIYLKCMGYKFRYDMDVDELNVYIEDRNPKAWTLKKLGLTLKKKKRKKKIMKLLNMPQ